MLVGAAPWLNRVTCRFEEQAAWLVVDDASPQRLVQAAEGRLVAELEHTFGISPSEAEIRGLTSVAAIRETRRAKNVRA